MKNKDDSWISMVDGIDGGERDTNLSHFNLLFLQGSQFIALRARFVGGRPSPFSGLVGDLARILVEVEALVFFERGGAEVEGEGSSVMVG